MATQRVYDPRTGKWTKKTVKDSKSSNTNNKNKSKNSGSLTSTKTDKKTSSGSSQKKSNKKIINTLEGTLSVVPNRTNIKIKSADTIKITGIGSQLSGRYYVKDVVKSLSSSGLQITLTVIKTNFRDTLKTTTKTTSKNKGKNTSETLKSKNSSTSSKNKKRTYVAGKGDTVYTVAKKFYKSGSKVYKDKIKKANNLSSDTLKKGQKLIIP